MLSDLSDPLRIVGLRQVMRAIEADSVSRVYVAQDAEAMVTKPLLVICGEKNIPVVYVESMKLLGQACNISVGASVAGIKK